jgi:hypothetical protein
VASQLTYEAAGQNDIALLIEALKSIGVAANKLSHAHLKADDRTPGHPGPT